jgi:hypothetical protein
MKRLCKKEPSLKAANPDEFMDEYDLNGVFIGYGCSAISPGR